MRIRPLWIVVAAPLLFAVTLLVQAYRVANAEYLEVPEYRVEASVGDGGRPLRVAVLGDSTAAGIGSPTIEDALPTLIATRVAESLDRRVDVMGYGVSGAVTADIASAQLPLIEEADVVVIVIGSNDVTHLTAPWRFDDQTREMLRSARQRGVPVVLGGIPLFDVVSFPQPLRWTVARWSTVHRGIQARVAQQIDGVTYVNIARDASPRFEGIPASMSSDGFHPGPIGYGFWADALAAGVVEAVGS